MRVPNGLSISPRGLAGFCLAVTTALVAGEAPAPSSGSAANGRTASNASILTRRDARAITLKIPAPRGQIVDREGEPFAQNVVAYQIGLQFRQFENADRDFVIRWGRARIEQLRPYFKNLDSPGDDELFEHYRHRRWLPLLISGQIDAKAAHALEPKLGPDLVLHPVYRRYYADGGLAAHLMGYVGTVGKLPTGPINFYEPMWEEVEGRAGFEKLFNQQLTGTPGTKRLQFDENGTKLLEEETQRPRPGGTLVTTLNLRWQRLAEKVLKEGCKRGAFVVIDVITGDVLVMASQPTFDPGVMIGINAADFKALNEDASHPLYSRAYQSVYPPASTFKPIVALAALNDGVITENTSIYCPAAIQIGDHVFNNWNKNPEGDLDVKRALARSCNPWFYQVGVKVGPTSFLGVASRLGYGKKTGLPLIGEAEGLVPTNEWMLKYEKRRIRDGDTANMSIGQGVLLASPLQVAQGMAGIANGGALPKLHLVKQVQDERGRVIEVTRPERQHSLGLAPDAIDIVRHGMRDVVNSDYGTGKAAALSFTELCGKTGTAQWGPPSKEQRLAWFAGFLPFDNPRYAFAVLYEGRPGEKVSGGRMSAPMVKAFFEPLKDEIKDVIAPPPKAVMIAPEGEGGPARAIPVDESDLEPIQPKEGVLKALPVEPLETGESASEQAPAEKSHMPTAPAEPEVPRARAVDPSELPTESEEGP
ncbi:MAG TPA: penicillin-binding transpeptidase domain-containing protein [Luteolibacter sp.]